MIVTFVITTLINVVLFVVNLFPNIPAMPQSIVDGTQTVLNMIANAIGVIDLIYSTPLMVAATIIVIGLVSWRFVYGAVMWVIHKIPMLNIH